MTIAAPLLRAIARTVAFLLLLCLALAGLALAVFSIQGGDDLLSPASLAQHLQLDELRDTVGGYLTQLEADGSAATRSALAGIGVVALALLLLFAAFVPRRSRSVALADGEKVEARPGALADAAEALSLQVPGVSDAQASVRPKRHGGGSLRVQPATVRANGAMEHAVRERLAPLASAFGLDLRVTARRAGKGERVR